MIMVITKEIENKKWIAAFIVLINFIFPLLLSVSAEAARLHPERFYQENWCAAHNGKLEHRLSDATRVDCLTGEYAIEVKFADKWGSAIGQTLFYAQMTNKRPGVVLIMESLPGDCRFLQRILIATQNIDGFKIWTIPEKGEC